MRSASNCRYPVEPIFPSDEFIARLGLITKLVQQFLQKLTPALDNAQNEVVTVGISRRQMPSVHKAMDVAFSSASSFEQRLCGSASVNVFCDELPPLHLMPTNWVVRKFWCIDQCIEIVVYGGCAQGGFSEQ